MSKAVVKFCLGLSVFILIIGLAFCFMLINSNNGETAFAAGNLPFDARARIGFAADNLDSNKFYIEDNGGAVTVRVYVSEVQTMDIPFTLTEDRFEGDDSLFVFDTGYVLTAGDSYVDVVFHQIAQAEEISGVRLSDVFIHCDTPTVRVGSVYYYGENEPVDDNFLAVVYDKDGDTELIVGGFPIKSLESDGSISSMFIRSGSVSSTTDAYYCIKDYDTKNTKELLFDNYNSVLSFEAGEREKTLELKFFDNDRLNLREAFQFEINPVDGTSKLFDITMRRYIEDGEEYLMPFAIEDDEPYSDRYIARVQYYQPGETDPKFEITEGGDIAFQINVYGLRDNTLPAFRVYYSVGINYTAEYGVNYTLGGNYRQDINLGYIEVPAGGNTYTGEIMLLTIDDSIYTGTRTVDIKFFLNNVQNILLQPLDSVRFEITDNEFLPSNNTISWSPYGTLNGYGTFQDNVLSLNYNNINDWIVIGVDTDYMGTLPLNIPVVFEDITAKNGREYYQESPYGLLVFRRDYLKYGIDINRRSNFKFTGTRRFKVSILEEGLTTGLSISGTNFIYVDMVGRIEDDYNYVEYTEAQIDDIFSIGKNEALSFKLRREETVIETTYIDLTRNEQGAFIEGTHIAAGIFPYEVVWAENEKEKLITIEFLPEWSSSINSPYASGYLSFLNGSKQPFNGVYGEDQKTSVLVTLYEGNSSAYYYFQGQENLSYVRYEYLYSSGSSLRIPVYREFVSPQAAHAAYTTVSYNLETIVYDPFDPKQPAEIGTHIDNLSGNLYFHGEETVQYINVTVPRIVGFAPGSKYVNLVLSDPGEKTYILSNRQDIYRYSLAQIKITNDVTPVLNYVDLTTTTVEEDSYETTSINPLEYVWKEFDSFKLELIPYDTDETPYLTDLYYSFDISLYTIYDLSTVGVEIFVNGSKVQCAGVSPYFYDGEFFGGSSATYGYAYATSVLVNKENPFITYTIKYSEIAQAGLSFLSTSLLLKATCPYFMNGWETYQKQLWLNACEEGASEEASLSVARVVTGGETNVQAGDIVYITVTRSSQDAAAATMFYESADYGIRSVPYSYDAVYYFVPLNTLITFAPYERSKTVPFVTRDNRPEGYAWDEAAATAVISLCYYQDYNVIFDELTVKVCEELGETVINAEVVLLSECIYVHKPSGEQDDTIAIKFIFDKIYDSDIEFTLAGMHQRIGNLTVTLPAGQTEIEHYLTFNEDNITETYMWIDISMTAELITDFDNTTLALTVPEGLNIVVRSRSISNQKFYAGEPGAYSMYESDSQGVSFEIIADRWQYPQYWPDINAYVRLGGTAVYGTDYYIDYESKGNHNYFDVTTGIVLIWKGTDRAIIHIYPIDNATSGQAKTIEVTILDYFYGYPAYPQTFNLSILDDEYFGDFYLSIGEDANRGGLTTIIPRRENNSRSSFTINYEVEEVFGVYGTDYQLQILNGFTNLPKSGTVTFQADIYYIIIHIVPYTELGKGAAFYFRISKDNEEACSIQDSEIFASARSLNNSGDYVARTVNGDTELDRRVSNYNSYLQDYTKYYPEYTLNQFVTNQLKHY
ncbi:hypothetical protein EOM82_04135 [bacterium]|nr:hypothetical protein [bacterium]